MAWRWAGARAVGTAHLAEGLPCQDAYGCNQWYRPGHEPVLIAALADGAGSAPKAQRGAQLAVRLTLEAVTEALDEDPTISDMEAIIRDAVDRVRQTMTLAAEADDHDPLDFASTLLVAGLSKEISVVGQIGDGAVVANTANGLWGAVHWPDHGEFANTTRFLTEPDSANALRITVIHRRVRGVAMFSDGLERLLLDFKCQTAHVPFFDPIFSRLDDEQRPGHSELVSDELAELLNSERVNARTNDDKTFVCALWQGA